MKFKYKSCIMATVTICAALLPHVTNNGNQMKALDLLNRSEIEALATNPESPYSLVRFCMMDAELSESMEVSHEQARQTSYGATMGWNKDGFNGTIDFHYIKNLSQGQTVTINLLRCCIFNNEYDDKCDFSRETHHDWCNNANIPYANERAQALQWLQIY